MLKPVAVRSPLGCKRLLCYVARTFNRGFLGVGLQLCVLHMLLIYLMVCSCLRLKAAGTGGFCQSDHTPALGPRGVSMERLLNFSVCLSWWNCILAGEVLCVDSSMSDTRQLSSCRQFWIVWC
jgi:hypothetical protein